MSETGLETTWGRDLNIELDTIDAVLIDEYQSGFPIMERPFRAVGQELDISETNALTRVRQLRETGIFRRFGAVLNPPVIGSSTLAAVSAPEDRFDDIATIINEYRQVNHNYRRDHDWNMWFVVTASAREKRDDILDSIETKTGCDVLKVPMLTDYYIDLEFPVVNTDTFARESVSETDVSATRISEEATGGLSRLEAELLVEIQDGFPLSVTPYHDIATAVESDVDAAAVVDAVDRLRSDGCIKRVGCVVNHIVTGFDANCMVVWNVPDNKLDTYGETVGEFPYVTLCYHRPRRPEQGWSYNLFTMIHGRESSAVDSKIDNLAAEHLPFEHERLYSTETLKQTGARYDELVGTAER
ncbi:siroheme decarboxylase subunit beta [Haloquadratum walsbyi]|jgi:DNA-binding Lrp family transcriptional regulator|uniref:siroheme decarboxylase n=1 Tax=Haloquadratum walsbyi (strain DSM 16854 / JCM 12705 / C23) TaxID=768065 RepID=G0LMT2_HALWC|nr:Lrp/AsnC family transcriptional regulator [Haloquadratum walsbyi]CCC41402.1 siroheme decarboxylase AhbA [Haloquadratum walsbyi C23]